MISPDVHVHHGFNLVPPQVVVTLSAEDAIRLSDTLYDAVDTGSLADEHRVLAEQLVLELQPAIDEAEAAIVQAEPTA